MIPVLTKNGRSFQGAAAYYLHDKRQADGQGGQSSERVAWTETLNLATDDPERAWRMMAHTAMAQADLKQAAGIKATGRKLANPVFAYSLSWDPSQSPTREVQMQAARETLKALGLDGHQAVIVAHNDEPHAHIHILVNRVNPENGLAATLSNSQLKLSQWALKWSKADGTDHLTPEREKNIEARKAGAEVDASRKPRAQYEAEKAAGNDNLKFEFTKTEQRQKDAQLLEAGRMMRTSHGRQWAELKRTYETVKGRMVKFTRQLKDRRTAELKEQARPRWAALFATQRTERQRFEAAERGTLSRFLNMAFVFQAVRRGDKPMDALTLFYTLLSSSQRCAVFEATQEQQRRALSRDLGRELKAELHTIDRKADADFTKLRDEYRSQCGQLKAMQTQQLEELKGFWRTRNSERRAAYKPFRARLADMEQGQGRRQRVHRSDARRPQWPPKNRGPAPG